MADDEGMPSVPTAQLEEGGWTLRDRTVETLFRLPTAQVRGHTLVYEDASLRGAVREATNGEVDLPWRFFFATRLSFIPPLAPGVGPASMFPTVHSEARKSFAEDLQDRGFRAVERNRSQRMRTAGGDRARLTGYDAVFDAGDLSVDIAGWLAVWVTGTEFRLAGGAYPARGFHDLPVDAGDVDSDPSTYRGELLDLIRAVE